MYYTDQITLSKSSEISVCIRKNIEGVERWAERIIGSSSSANKLDPVDEGCYSQSKTHVYTYTCIDVF